MNRFENILKKTFVISSVYLLVIILGGFFIIPGIFNIENLNLPIYIEIFIKISSFMAMVIVLTSAALLPITKYFKTPKRQINSPTYYSASTLLIGVLLILLNALYVKIRTCPIGGGDKWFCQVEGKSYAGMLVLVFVLSAIVGYMVWLFLRISNKKK